MKVSVDFGADADMQRSDDGVWTVTVGPLDPETYLYFFTVDGVRLTAEPLDQPQPARPSVPTGDGQVHHLPITFGSVDGYRSAVRWKRGGKHEDLGQRFARGAEPPYRARNFAAMTWSASASLSIDSKSRSTGSASASRPSRRSSSA